MKADHIWLGLTIILLVAHGLAVLGYLKFDKSFRHIPLLNMVVASGVIIYWVIRAIQVEDLYLDWWMVVHILFELLAIGIAIGYFREKPLGNWMHWTVFSVHFGLILLSLGVFLLMSLAKPRLF